MYTINSNLLSKTGYTADQLKKAEESFSPSNGYHPDVYKAIVKAEQNYGLNALFILAHADVESAHGNSYYAKTRNNLFGFNAVDSNPDLASSYPTEAASIDFYAHFLYTHYLFSGGPYYNGATPHGVFSKYSSSHDAEAYTVVQIMNALEARINGVELLPTPKPLPLPVTKPAPHTYYVQPGDVLSRIAAKYPGTTVNMWVNANRRTFPQITRDYIQAGWRLVIPGGNPSHAAPATAHKYRVARRGDTVWGWGFRPPYSKFVKMNPGVDPDHIFEGRTYRVA